MADEMIVRKLKSLADPTRLHIVEFLSGCCCGQAAIRDDGDVESPTAGEVCCHITGADKINSTISHHLHDLEDSGLVRLEKRGKATLCTLHTEGLLALSAYLVGLTDPRAAKSCCND
ncbi:MAG: helix-turn-helix transcriptional regulator [Armatimonadetes bacterium]|nr:helix-turn-helix transcriptional regulator [Armatimonadota bacterium]